MSDKDDEVVKEYDLNKDDDLRNAEFDEELNEWLSIIAETCVAHMKHIEANEVDNPEALTDEDYGILELERGFLVLYALQTKGGLPVTSKEQESH